MPDWMIATAERFNIAPTRSVEASGAHDRLSNSQSPSTGKRWTEFGGAPGSAINVFISAESRVIFLTTNEHESTRMPELARRTKTGTKTVSVPTHSCEFAFIRGLIGGAGPVHGRTLRITDPAPIVIDMKPRRYRRVRCIRFDVRRSHVISKTDPVTGEASPSNTSPTAPGAIWRP